ncbi:unnamed protein product [Phytophthora fragariaefolia]|uniref:Unnamed protein product n=1 Tax=Phytophthora fragariaefolia TaxID=1490495 RepID=A0A9W6TPY9_9STRA|nr:unnamed protein product [Phytophthora fragariaefolia]
MGLALLKTDGKRRAVLSNTERVCEPGLLVVQATVKGVEKPWTILIDLGTSGNYARCSPMEGSQLYAEALKAPWNAVVLNLDARYDLILDMAWLERHGPWAMDRLEVEYLGCYALSRSLASHEPTSALKQKRFWREHWTETVNVLEIGMSEIMDTESVGDKGPKQSSWAERGVARNPPSDARGEAASLHAHEGMVGSEPRHQVCGPNDACGVTQNPLSGGCGQSSTSLSVGRDTEALTELGEVMTPEGAAGAATTDSRRRTTSAKWRRRRKILAARRMASEMSRDVSDVVSGIALYDSELLYTLVSGVTGDVDGDVNLGEVPKLAAVFELGETSFDEFGEALQAGELAEVVVIRPEEELNASSILDEAVLEAAKNALNARSR